MLRQHVFSIIIKKLSTYKEKTMTSQEMLLSLKGDGFHTSIVYIGTGIPYHRLDKCKNGLIELKESEYKMLLGFYEINTKDKYL